jgi:hypothetical protein
MLIINYKMIDQILNLNSIIILLAILLRNKKNKNKFIVKINMMIIILTINYNKTNLITICMI